MLPLLKLYCVMSEGAIVGCYNSKIIFLIILCTLFTCIGQLFFKRGSALLDGTMGGFLNWFLVLGFTSYGLGALFMIFAFREGELSVLYPILATSYLWVGLLSVVFFGEVLTVWKWSGMILILLSVSVLGFSVRGGSRV